jgi:hypothetical protein
MSCIKCIYACMSSIYSRNTWRYIHICTHEGNAYLYGSLLYQHVFECISVCINRDAYRYIHICTPEGLKGVHIRMYLNCICMYLTVCPILTVFSPEYIQIISCFIQRRLLRRLLRACCACAAFSASSTLGCCTFQVVARSLHVCRAGSACTGRSPISFGICPRDMIAVAGGNRRGSVRAEDWTGTLARLVGSGSRGNSRRDASNGEGQ